MSEKGSIDVVGGKLEIKNCDINIYGDSSLLRDILSNTVITECDVNILNKEQCTNSSDSDDNTEDSNYKAVFEKVSYERFREDYIDCFGDTNEEIIVMCYDNIRLPERATTGSAGYDFFCPMDITLTKETAVKIPTGIRCKMSNDIVLNLYPRSGLGFKYKLRLNNTVGIIDSDYYNADNEGHIMLKLQLEGDKDCVKIGRGCGIVQGIFNRYYTAKEDDVTSKRTGGFGSTNK